LSFLDRDGTDQNLNRPTPRNSSKLTFRGQKGESFSLAIDPIGRRGAAPLRPSLARRTKLSQLSLVAAQHAAPVFRRRERLAPAFNAWCSMGFKPSGTGLKHYPTPCELETSHAPLPKRHPARPARNDRARTLKARAGSKDGLGAHFARSLTYLHPSLAQSIRFKPDHSVRPRGEDPPDPARSPINPPRMDSIIDRFLGVVTDLLVGDDDDLR
jgi:hypothetical protein